MQCNGQQLEGLRNLYLCTSTNSGVCSGSTSVKVSYFVRGLLKKLGSLQRYSENNDKNILQIFKMT